MEPVTNFRKWTTGWDTSSQSNLANIFSSAGSVLSRTESESDSMNKSTFNVQRREWNQIRKRQRFDSDSDDCDSILPSKISRHLPSSRFSTPSSTSSKSRSWSRSLSRSSRSWSRRLSRRSRSLSRRSRSLSRRSRSLSRRSRSLSRSSSSLSRRSMSLSRRSRSLSRRSRSLSRRSRSSSRRSRSLSRRSRSMSRRPRSLSRRSRSKSRRRSRSPSGIALSISRRSRSLSRRSRSMSRRSRSLSRRSRSKSRRRSRSPSGIALSISRRSRSSKRFRLLSRRSRSLSRSSRSLSGRSRSLSRRSRSLSRRSRSLSRRSRSLSRRSRSSSRRSRSLSRRSRSMSRRSRSLSKRSRSLSKRSRSKSRRRSRSPSGIALSISRRESRSLSRRRIPRPISRRSRSISGKRRSRSISRRRSRFISRRRSRSISRRRYRSISRRRSRSIPRQRSRSISRRRSRSISRRRSRSISRRRSRSISRRRSRSLSRRRSRSISRRRSRSIFRRRSRSISRRRSRSISRRRSRSISRRRSRSISTRRSRSISTRSRSTSRRSRSVSRRRRSRSISRRQRRRSRSLSRRSRSVSRKRRSRLISRRSRRRRSRSVSRRSRSISRSSRSISNKRRSLSISKSTSSSQSISLMSDTTSESAGGKRSWISDKHRPSGSSITASRTFRRNRTHEYTGRSKRAYSNEVRRFNKETSGISRLVSPVIISSQSTPSMNIPITNDLVDEGRREVENVRGSSSLSSSSSETSESDKPKLPAALAWDSSRPESESPRLMNLDTELFPFVEKEDLTYFKNMLSCHNTVLSFREQQKRELIGLVLKIKNGTPEVAKLAVKSLQRLARTMDTCLLLNTLLPFLTQTMENDATIRVMGCIDAIVFKLGVKMKPYLRKTLIVVQALFAFEDARAQGLAFRVITRITKVCGMASMIANLKEDMDAVDVFVRRVSCMTLAVVTSVVGFEKMLPFIRSLTTSKLSPLLRISGVKIIHHAVGHVGEKARPFIPQLVELVEPELCDTKSCGGPGREVLDAVSAVVSIAQKSDEQLFKKMFSCLLLIYCDAQKMEGCKNTVNIQNTLSCLLRLQSTLTEDDLQALETGLKADCSSLEICMKMMGTLSKCTLVTSTQYSTRFLQPFVIRFLTCQNCHHKDLKEKFLKLCLRSCRKVKVEDVCRCLLSSIDHCLLRHLDIVSEAFAKILHHYGTKDLPYDVEKEILMSICTAVNILDSQEPESLPALLTVMKAMGKHLYFHAANISETLNDQPDASDKQRYILEQIYILLNGSSQSEGSMLGLVTDGSVLNMKTSI